MESKIANPQNQQESEELEIDLVELLYRLLEKIKWLILAAVLGAVLAGVYTFRFVTPMYQSTAKMYILGSKDSVINLSDLQIGSNLTADYKEVFNNWHVSEMVLQRLGDETTTYSEIQRSISINNPTGTRVLYITATSPSPQRAADIANTYCDVAREFIAARMGTEEPSEFETARVPERPYSPNKTRNIAIGFLLGGIIAAAIVVIQFIADDRIRTGEMVEKRLGIPTLGLMPAESLPGNQKKGRGRTAKKTTNTAHSGKGGSKA